MITNIDLVKAVAYYVATERVGSNRSTGACMYATESDGYPAHCIVGAAIQREGDFKLGMEHFAPVEGDAAGEALDYFGLSNLFDDCSANAAVAQILHDEVLCPVIDGREDNYIKLFDLLFLSRDYAKERNRARHAADWPQDLIVGIRLALGGHITPPEKAFV